MDKLTNIQVFRDPIYGYIHVEYRFIKELIDTFVFQRLRRIKQLSGVCMVFHCAEHSRFSHSLGVYELANRLCKNNDVNNTLSDREKLLLLTSALLHDIGHGAYSHAFEDVFKVNHEQIGARIIKEDQEIQKILSQVDEKFSTDCSNIILHKSPYKIIESLISSQIDIDRLDYLGRDAYFTGAPYGYVDFERIIRIMRIVDGRVVFKESGIHAIENYLISRYHMYWQVYYHKTARGYEIILEKIYNRIYDLLKERYHFINNVQLIAAITKNPHSIHDYLQIDDNYINSLIVALLNEEDPILHQLCYDFTHRKIWASLPYDPSNELIKNIIAKGNLYNYCIRGVSQNTYNETTIIDNSINILLDDGSIKSILNVSPVVNSLQTSGYKEDLRFFYRHE
ncbi:MAG: HD domain-containing protein [Acholeplasmatales bacterium]|jgi:putative nucleotidyltransferase with HDIG domain|nr:HD domain-containing protein [Acholeplasmatales bacterium]